MNLGIFIARKLSSKGNNSITRRIIKVASASVAISIVVMILAIGIVRGFQQEIKRKINLFNGSAVIKNLDLNHSGEFSMFSLKSINTKHLLKNNFIKSIEPFCRKYCIARTTAENEGMQCKGISNGECFNFFKNHLKKGRMFEVNSQNDPNEILISEITANRLGLDTGLHLELIFVNEGQLRRRKPKICGIFNSGVNEIDKVWLITDLRMVQRVVTNGYDSVNGISVYFNSNEKISHFSKLLNENLPMDLTVETVEETNFQIYQWLKLLDLNVVVIIILMILVSIVNMTTALIVLIIDRTTMIGLLKALGSRNFLIRQIFIFSSAKYLFKGILAGNIIGILLGYIQKKWHLVSLNEETYYLSHVPFSISFSEIFMLNIFTFGVCLILLIIPSLYVAKINPAKSIKFD
ncbi:MAG: ABC transporter permease [Bacteroidetes bacterium]|nr:ABC transporter permease [Bacteroidota bacterium]